MYRLHSTPYASETLRGFDLRDGAERKRSNFTSKKSIIRQVDARDKGLRENRPSYQRPKIWWRKHEKKNSPHDSAVAGISFHAIPLQATMITLMKNFRDFPKNLYVCLKVEGWSFGTEYMIDSWQRKKRREHTFMASNCYLPHKRGLHKFSSFLFMVGPNPIQSFIALPNTP